MFFMTAKKFTKKFIAILCICSLTLPISSCNKTASTTEKTNFSEAEKKEQQEDFDNFLDQLFIEDVQSDSITLNYTLSKPQDYGITNFTPTFGEYSIDHMKEELITVENTYKKLTEFPYNALTQEQQLIYDILADYYKITGTEEKYLLYGEVLGSTTGIQAQLPILLAEYNFYTKEDIAHYLDLLLCVPEYFSKIGEFEREKSKAGLFMSKDTANNIIDQCKTFVKNPKKNYLIDIFNDRIDAYEGLTEKEKTEFKKKNKNAILNSVIPAYEDLITLLEELKSTGRVHEGTCSMPDGKEYYEILAKSISGSNKSIKEMKKALSETAYQASLKMNNLYQNDNGIFEDFVNMKFPMTNPEEIIPYLTKKVEEDFPALEPVNCTVKYVHESLEDHLSPAFYLTPAIDNYENNSVYINGNDEYDLSQIYPTVAHESYPGHLLQSVYFNQQNPHPIRSMLNYGGYSEGWATYCEMYSYEISGLDRNVAEYAKQYSIFTLCLYAEMDIGVNYDGWDLEELKDYLSDYGITDESVAKSAYDLVIDDPANYLQYVIGYIEFAQLRKKAEDTLGDNFNAKEFHTFLLDIGPAPFYIIDSYMEKWMEE